MQNEKCMLIATKFKVFEILKSEILNKNAKEL